jgi:hypothetical protein
MDGGGRSHRDRALGDVNADPIRSACRRVVRLLPQPVRVVGLQPRRPLATLGQGGWPRLATSRSCAPAATSERQSPFASHSRWTAHPERDANGVWWDVRFSGVGDVGPAEVVSRPEPIELGVDAVVETESVAVVVAPPLLVDLDAHAGEPSAQYVSHAAFWVRVSSRSAGASAKSARMRSRARNRIRPATRGRPWR